MYEFNLIPREQAHELLMSWWLQREFVKEFSVTSLPTTCVQVTNKALNVPVAILPIYQTDSDIAWLGFPSTNPSVGAADKKYSIQEGLKFAKTLLKESGLFNSLITTTGTQPIREALEGAEFEMTECGVDFFTTKI